MPHRRRSPIHFTPIEKGYLDSLSRPPPGPSGPSSPPFRINLDMRWGELFLGLSVWAVIIFAGFAYSYGASVVFSPLLGSADPGWIKMFAYTLIALGATALAARSFGVAGGAAVGLVMLWPLFYSARENADFGQYALASDPSNAEDNWLRMLSLLSAVAVQGVLVWWTARRYGEMRRKAGYFWSGPGIHELRRPLLAQAVLLLAVGTYVVCVVEVLRLR